MDNNLIVFEQPKLTPAKVEWDKQSLIDKIQMVVDEFDGLVLTESTLKDGKSTCADLNKLKASINDEAKRIDKLLSEDVKIFRAEIKEVIALIDNAYNPIKAQMDGFEQARQDEKRQKIQKMIDELIDEQGLVGEYAAELVIQKSYLNKSTSLKSIQEELTQIATAAGLTQDEYDKNIDLIEQMVKSNNDTFGVNLMSHQYIKLLAYKSVPEIMMEITKDAQLSVPVPVEKSVETLPVPADAYVEEGPTDGDDEIFLETYDVEGTERQLDLLQQFMEENDIKFKVVE
jgi:hypothetical protein